MDSNATKLFVISICQICCNNFEILFQNRHYQINLDPNLICITTKRLRTFRATKSAKDISAQHNRHRSESAQKKNELTLLYSALIKKKWYAFDVFEILHLMVTRYIGNMIAFLHCHYAYLSIAITSKLSALNHNKILYYCNCHATISSSVHTFARFFRRL